MGPPKKQVKQQILFSIKKFLQKQNMSARMVVKNMGLLTASRTTTDRRMVWTPWRGSRAKQKTKIQNTLMRCILTLSNGQLRLQQIWRWHLQTKQYMEVDGMSKFQQVDKSMPGGTMRTPWLTVKKPFFSFCFPSGHQSLVVSR